jgi:alkanesulfonate monooxygenase SsuD/methylene tetrahydromethanopterin reductase-like flavin-dependent oxidoreductase (luciferase family)
VRRRAGPEHWRNGTAGAPHEEDRLSSPSATGRPRRTRSTRSAADALLQSIDLAVAAEELGADGAYFRVHHFARQLASPFPLLAAAAREDQRIEIGTAVIDMRYENPLYMAEDAGAADLIAGGRLQLGISRGSPEQVIDGLAPFRLRAGRGRDRRRHGARPCRGVPRRAARRGLRPAQPAPDVPQPAGPAAARAAFGGPARAHLVGRGLDATAVWAAKLGMNLQSSTLKFDESGKPFHIQQAEQIAPIARPGRRPGHAARRASRSAARSSPLVNDMDRAYFGRGGQSEDHFGYIEPGKRAVFGRSYAAEPDRLIEQLRATRPSPRPTRCC